MAIRRCMISSIDLRWLMAIVKPLSRLKISSSRLDMGCLVDVDATEPVKISESNGMLGSIWRSIVDSCVSTLATSCTGLACCCVGFTDRLEEFAEEIKSALSSIKYKWVLVLIANYHSQSRSVKYILDNFATLDILSEDIDFYFPGYGNNVDMPIIPNRETVQKDILTKAMAKLHDLSKDRNLPKAQIDAMIEAVTSKLCTMEESGHNRDKENFHGNATTTKINCKRLGTIRFSEEAFASFVVDLMKACGGKYKYLGGCDLVMIPFFNDGLQYHDCSVFHLEDMASIETRLSADAFMLQVINTLKQYNDKLMVPQICDEEFSNAIEKINKCVNELNVLLSNSKDVPDCISELAHRANILMAQSNRFWFRVFGKKGLR